MNFPNMLTVSRIALSAAFLIFLFSPSVTAKVLAFVIFFAACITDFLDGYIAKRYHQVTDFGKLMDPVADKILVLSAFLAFVQMQIIPVWVTLVIIFREVLITGLRILALSKGEVIAASGAGKHKTVSQLVTIGVILLYVIFDAGGTGTFSFSTADLKAAYHRWIDIFTLIVVVFTLISGVSYMIKNRRIYAVTKTD